MLIQIQLLLRESHSLRFRKSYVRFFFFFFAWETLGFAHYSGIIIDDICFQAQEC